MKRKYLNLLLLLVMSFSVYTNLNYKSVELYAVNIYEQNTVNEVENLKLSSEKKSDIVETDVSFTVNFNEELSKVEVLLSDREIKNIDFKIDDVVSEYELSEDKMSLSFVPPKEAGEIDVNISFETSLNEGESYKSQSAVNLYDISGILISSSSKIGEEFSNIKEHDNLAVEQESSVPEQVNKYSGESNDEVGEYSSDTCEIGGCITAPAPPPSNQKVLDTFDTVPGSNSYVSSEWPSTVILSQNAKYEKGAMWSKNKLDLDVDFGAEMNVYVGDKNNINKGADGFTFTLQNDPRTSNSIGATGAGLSAYANSADSTYIKNALSFEWDTYYNHPATATDVDDLQVEQGTAVSEADTKSKGHFAVVRPGAPSSHIKMQKLETGLTDDKWHNFKVFWDASESKINFDLDNGQVKSDYVISDVNSYFGGSEVYWGFTGGTGSSTNTQAISLVHLPSSFAATKQATTSIGNDTEVTHGETINYSISVKNTGTVTEKYKVSDPLNDPTFQYVNYTDNDAVTVEGIVGGTKTYKISNLKSGIEFEIEPGKTANVKFKVIADNQLPYTPGKINNQAKVCLSYTLAGVYEPVCQYPKVSAEYDYTVPKITSEKIITDANNNGVAEPGEKLHNEITYKNVSEAKLESFKIVDHPTNEANDGVKNDSLTNTKIEKCTSAGCTSTGEIGENLSNDDKIEVTFLNELKKDEYVKVSYDVVAEADMDLLPTKIVNKATASFSKTDFGGIYPPGFDENSLIAQDEITTDHPSFTITKTATKSPNTFFKAEQGGVVRKGDEIKYKIDVKNTSTKYQIADMLVTDNFTLDKTFTSSKVTAFSAKMGSTNLVTGTDYELSNLTVGNAPGNVTFKSKKPIPAGQSLVLEITLKMGDVYGEDGKIAQVDPYLKNIATASSIGANKNSKVKHEKSAEHIFKSEKATLSPSKTYKDEDGDKIAEPNEKVTFSINYKNNGATYNGVNQKVPIENLKVIDPLTNWASYANLSGATTASYCITTDGNCDSETKLTGNIQTGITIPVLEAGSSVLISFEIIMKPTFTDTASKINNTATATYTGNTTGVKAYTDVPVAIPDVAISKVVTSPSKDQRALIDPQDPTKNTIKYKVEFELLDVLKHPDILSSKDLVIYDALIDPFFDAGLVKDIVVYKDGVKVTTGFTVDSKKPDELKISFAEIKEGEKWKIEFSAKANEANSTYVLGNPIRNTVWADFTKRANAANTFGEKSASATTKAEDPILAIKKTVTDTDLDQTNIAEPGETLNYTIDINSTNGINAKNVVVYDPLDKLGFAAPPSVTATVWEDKGSGTYVDTKISGDITKDGGLKIPLLNGDSKYQVRFSLKVPTDLNTKTIKKISNTATTYYLKDGTTKLGVKTSTAEIPTDKAELKITKSVTPEIGNYITSGDILTYTIKVQNTSALATANKVQIIDELSSQVFNNAEIVANSFTVGGVPIIEANDKSVYKGDIKLDIINTDILPTKSVDFTFKVKLSDNLSVQEGSVVENEACALAEFSTKICAKANTIQAYSNLKIEDKIYKNADFSQEAELVTNEDIITYKIITGHSDDSLVSAYDVVIQDVFSDLTAIGITPTILGFIDDNGNAAKDDGEIDYTLGTTIKELKTTQDVVVTVEATLPSNLDITNINNEASATWVNHDPVNPGMVSDSVNVAVKTPTALFEKSVIEKMDANEDPSRTCTIAENAGGDCVVDAGDILTYTLKITNQSTELPIKSAHIVDEFSKDNSFKGAKIDLESIKADASVDGISIETNLSANNPLGAPKLDLTLDKIDPSEVVTVTFDVELSDKIDGVNETELSDISLENIAYMDSNSVTSTSEHDYEDTAIVKSNYPRISAEKTVTDMEDGVAEANETLYYSVVVNNISGKLVADGGVDSPVPVDNLIVKDDFAAMLSFVDLSTLSDTTLEISDATGVISTTTMGKITEGVLVDELLDGQTAKLTFNVNTVSGIEGLLDLANVASIDNQSCDVAECLITNPTANITMGVAKPTIVKNGSFNDENQNGAIDGSETFDYTLLVSNIDGSANLDNIKVIDMLSNSVFEDSEYVIGEALDQDGTPVNITSEPYVDSDFKEGFVIDILDTIKPNNSVLIPVKVTLPSVLSNDYIPGTAVENIAHVDDPRFDNSQNIQELCSFEKGTPIGDHCDDWGKEEIKRDISLSVDVNDTSAGDGDSLAEPGEIIEYVMVVTNKTGLETYEILIRDELVEQLGDYIDISGLEQASIVKSSDGSTLIDENLSDGISVGTLKSKEVATIKFQLKVKEDIPDESIILSNSATVSAKDEDTSSLLDNTDMATMNTGKPKLEISKSHKMQEEIIRAGSAITYNFNIKNSGNSTANDIYLKDDFTDEAFKNAVINDISSSQSFIDDSVKDPSNPLYATEGIKIDLSGIVLEPGDSIDIAAEVKLFDELPVNEGSAVSNKAFAKDIYSLEVSDTDDIEQKNTDLSIDMQVTDSEDSENTAQNNEILKYVIEVRNDSDIIAYDVAIENIINQTLLNGIGDVSLISVPFVYVEKDDVPGFSGTDEDVSTSGSILTGYKIDSLKSYESIVIEYEATLSSNLAIESITNQASVSSKNETNFRNNNTEKIIDVTHPDINIEKTFEFISDDDQAIEGSDVIKFGYTVKNAGLARALDVRVLDEFNFDDDFMGSKIVAIEYLNSDNSPFDPTRIASSSNELNSELNPYEYAKYDETFNYLEPGEEINIFVTLELNSELILAKNLTNIAYAESPTVSNGVYSEQDSEVILGIGALGDEKLYDSSSHVSKDSPNSELKIDKSVSSEDGDEFAEPNEKLNYHIEVKNENATPAVNVQIQDTMDELKQIDSTLPDVFNVEAYKNSKKYEGNLRSEINGADALVIDDIKENEVVTVDFSVKLPEVFEMQDPGEIDGKVNNISNAYTEGVLSDSDDSQLMLGSPELIVLKSVLQEDPEDTVIQPGEVLTYTITTQNNGTATANEVAIIDELTDSIFTGSTIDEESIQILDNSGAAITGANYELPISGGIKVVVPEIKMGEKVDVIFDVKITDPLPEEYIPGEQVKNTAYSDDPITPNNPPLECEDFPGDACGSTGIEETESNVRLQKIVTDADGDNFAEPKEELEYKIISSNITDVPAKNVVVTDLLTEVNISANIDNIEAITYNDDGDGVYTANEIVNTTGTLQTGLALGTIAPHDIYTTVFKVTMDEEVLVNKIDNAVTGTMDNGKVTDANASIKVGKPILTVDKSYNQSLQSVEDSSEIDYNIKVTNTGLSTANQVVVEDLFEDPAFDGANIMQDSLNVFLNDTALSEGTGYVDNSSYKTPKLHLTDIMIPPNGILSIDFSVKLNDKLPVEEGSEVENVATATDNLGNWDEGNSIIAQADSQIQLYESVSDDPTDTNPDGVEKASNNETLSYTLKLENKKSIAAYDVVLKDDFSSLPKNTKIENVSVFRDDDISGGYSSGDEILAESKKALEEGIIIDRLDMEYPVYATFNATMPEKLAIEEIVDESVSLDQEHDMQTISNASAQIPVENPEMQINKVGNEVDSDGEIMVQQHAVINSNDSIKYTLDVQNLGNVDAYDVRVYDLLDNDSSFDRANIKENSISVKDDSGNEVLSTRYDKTNTEFEAPNPKFDITIMKMTPYEKLKIEFIVELSDDLDSGLVDYSLENMGNVDSITQANNLSDFDDQDEEILTSPLPKISGIKEVTDADGDNVAEPNEKLSYEISITNDGIDEVPAQNIHVHDPLTDFVNADTSDANDVGAFIDGVEVARGDLMSENPESGLVIPAILPGQSAKIKFDVILPEILDGTEYENTVIVEIPDNPDDPLVDPNSPPHVSIPTGKSKLEVIKSGTQEDEEDSVIHAGEKLTYEFEITNKSMTANADDIIVEDELINPIFTNADVLEDEITVTDEDGNPMEMKIVDTQGRVELVIDKIEKRKAAYVSVGIRLSNPLPDEYEQGNLVDNEVSVDDPLTPNDPSDPECISNCILKPGDDEDDFEFGAVDPKLEVNKEVSDIKGDGDNTAEPGETLSYMIEVINTSDVKMKNVILEDKLEDALFVGADISATTDLIVFDDDNINNVIDPEEFIAQGNLLEGITIEEFPMHETYKILFDIRLPKEASVVELETLTNRAKASSFHEQTQSEISDTDDADIKTGQSDVEIIKTAVDDNNFINDGDSVTYNFQLINHGDAQASSVSLIDEFNDPAFIGSEIVGIHNSDNIAGLKDNSIREGDIRLALDDIVLEPQSEGRVSVVIKFPDSLNVYEGSEVVNTATTEDDNTTTPPDDDTEIIEKNFPELDVTKSVKDSEDIGLDNEISNNEVARYDIKVENISDVAAYDVKISDPVLELVSLGAQLSNAVVYNETEKSRVSANIDETGVWYIVEKIKPGEIYHLSFDAKMPENLRDGNQISNTANVNLANSSPDMPEGGYTADAILNIENPTLAISKDGYEINDEEIYDSNGVMDAFDTIRYEVQVENTSDNAIAYDVNILDEFPDVSFDDAILDQVLIFDEQGTPLDSSRVTNTSENNRVDIVIDKILPQEKVNLIFDITLGGVLENGLVDYSLDNTVTADSSTIENKADYSYDARDSARIVGPMPQVSGTKEVVDEDGDLIAEPNEKLTYTIKIKNDSPLDVPAQNVHIYDSLSDFETADISDAKSVDAYIGENIVASGDLTSNDPVTGVVIPAILPNEEVIIIFDVIMGSIIDDDIMQNTVNVEIPDNPDDPIVDPPGVEIPTGESDLNILKSGFQEDENDSVIQAGEELRYNFEIENKGTSNSNNVVFIDELANPIFENADILEESIVAINQDGAPVVFEVIDSTDKIKILFDEIKVGEIVTLNLAIKLSDPLPQDYQPGDLVDNQAWIDDPYTPNDPVDPECTISCELEPGDDDDDHTFGAVDPKLELIKTVSDEKGDADLMAEPGETLTYTIDVVNTSDIDAQNVFVQDELKDLIAVNADISLAKDVTIFNDINANDTFDDNEFVAQGDLTSGINIEQLKKGETNKIRFDVVLPLNESVISLEEITNRATAQFVNEETSNVIVAYDTANILTGMSEVVIDKSSSIEDGFINDGDTVFYSFALTNNGDAIANNVSLVDEFEDPAFKGSEIISITSDSSNQYGDNSTLTGDIKLDLNNIVIAPGETVVITTQIKFDDPLSVFEGSEVKNTATVDDGYTTTPPESDTEIIEEVLAELDVKKSAVDSEEVGLDNEISNNEIIHYDIRVENISDVSAYGVEVLDEVTQLRALDAEITNAVVYSEIYKKRIPANIDEKGVWFVIEKIHPGEVYHMSFDAKMPGNLNDGNKITNTVSVNLDNPSENVPEGGYVDDAIMNIENPTLDITKNGHEILDQGADEANGVVDAFDIIKYEVQIKNTSDNAYAYDVNVVDQFPDVSFEGSNLNSVDVFNSLGENIEEARIKNNSTNENVDLVIDSLAPGESVDVVFDISLGSVLQDGLVDYKLDNVVTADSPTIENRADYSYDAQAGISILSPMPQVSGTKEVVDADGDLVAEPNEKLTYTITVKNDSPLDVPAQNVHIYDALSDFETADISDAKNVEALIGENVVATGDLTSNDPNTGVVVPAILPGEEVKIIFDVIMSSVIDDDMMENTVSVEIPDNPNDPIIDPPGVEIPTGQSDLNILKTGSQQNEEDNVIKAGEVLTYSFEITNNGSAAANNVVFKDELENPIFENADVLEESIVAKDQDGNLVDVMIIDTTDRIELGFEKIDIGKKVFLDLSLKLSDPLSENYQQGDLVDNQAWIDDPYTPNDPSDPECEADCVLNPGDDDDDHTFGAVDPVLDIDKNVYDLKGDNDFMAEPGETLTYTIDVQNTSDVDAQNILIKDTLENLLLVNADIALAKDAVVFDDMNANGVFDTEEFVAQGDLTQGINIDELKMGQTNKIIFDVILPKENSVIEIDEIKNIATAHTINEETGSEIMVEDDANILTGKSEVIIDKTSQDENGYITDGEEVTYDFAITNNGDAIANNVFLLDEFDDPAFVGSEIVSVSSNSSNSYIDNSVTTSDIKLDLDDIVVGVDETVVISVVIKFPDPLNVFEGSEVVNTASVGDDNTTTPPEDDEDILLEQLPELKVEKTAVDTQKEGLDNQVSNNEIIHYDIRVENISAVTAYNVEIMDPITELKALNVEMSNANISDENLEILNPATVDQSGVWSIIEKVRPGEVYHLTFDAKMPSNLVSGEEIYNQVFVNLDNPSENVPEGGYQDDAVIEIKNPEISLVKEGYEIDSNGEKNSNGVIDSSDMIEYEIIIENLSEDTYSFDNNVTDLFTDVSFRGALLEKVSVYDSDGKIMTDGYTDNSNYEDIKLDVVINELAPKEKVSIIVDVKLPEVLENGLVDYSLENVAYVDSPTIENEKDVLYDAMDNAVIITPEQELVGDKTVKDSDGDGLAFAGEELTYTIEFTNISTVATPAQDVYIYDDLSDLDRVGVMYDVSNIDAKINGEVVATGNLQSEGQDKGSLSDNGILVPVIKAGETVVVEFVAKCSEDLNYDDIITNVAAANGEVYTDPAIIKTAKKDEIVVNKILKTGQSTQLILILVTTILLVSCLLLKQRKMKRAK